MRRFLFGKSRSEQRDLTSAEFENAVNKVLTANAVKDASSHIVITQESPLSLSAVWACVRNLSGTVGNLPIHLYKRTDRGRERLYDHACHHILQTPNSYSNRYDLMHFLMISCTLWGNGYARVYRDKFYRPARLKFYHPAKV